MSPHTWEIIIRAKFDLYGRPTRTIRDGDTGAGTSESFFIHSSIMY